MGQFESYQNNNDFIQIYNKRNLDFLSDVMQTKVLIRLQKPKKAAICTTQFLGGQNAQGPHSSRKHMLTVEALLYKYLKIF